LFSRLLGMRGASQRTT